MTNKPQKPVSDTPICDAERDDARNFALDFECKNPPPKEGENIYVIPYEVGQRLERENIKLKSALYPFCPGVDPIPWGKIKAHLPTDLAKLLTHFQVRIDKALSTNPSKGESK